MSDDSSPTSYNDQRAEALRIDFAARQSRLFINFAIVEAVLLGTLILAIYAFNIIDPEVGIWMIVGLALVSGFILSMLLVTRMRAHQQALQEITGR